MFVFDFIHQKYDFKLITFVIFSLGKYMDLVIWSTEGSHFAVSADNKIHVFDVNVAGIILTIECTSRITSMSFFDVSVIKIALLCFVSFEF